MIAEELLKSELAYIDVMDVSADRKAMGKRRAQEAMTALVAGGAVGGAVRGVVDVANNMYKYDYGKGMRPDRLSKEEIQEAKARGKEKAHNTTIEGGVDTKTLKWKEEREERERATNFNTTPKTYNPRSKDYDPELDDLVRMEVKDYLDRNPSKRKMSSDKLASDIASNILGRSSEKKSDDIDYIKNVVLKDPDVTPARSVKQDANETNVKPSKGSTYNSSYKPDSNESKREWYTESQKESKLKTAKEKDMYDLNFLEAIQNSKILDQGNKTAIDRQYKIYLDDPDAYWDKARKLQGA